MKQELSREELVAVISQLDRVLKDEERKELKFVDFVRQVAPWFVMEEIHLAIGEKLDLVADGHIDRLMIFMPPRAGKPVEVNTPILSASGEYIPLKDIVAGDRVITDKGRSRLVTKVFEQGLLPCLELQTKSGRTVKAAHDHPFLTPYGWVNAGDLKIGDVLAIPNGITIHPTNDMTPEEARLLGYFVGDGNTTAYKSRSNCSITCYDDIQARDIKHCAESLGFNIGKVDDKQMRYPVINGGRPWLRRHGLAGCTSRQKRVPKEIFSASDEAVANYIGAHFACDGSIYKKSAGRKWPTVQLYSVNKELMQDVQHLLARLGINAYLSIKRGSYKEMIHEGWRLCLYSRDDIARFADKVPVYGRKGALLEEVRGKKTAFEPAYLGDTVVSIQEAGALQCRCLEVEEDHTFLANDIVVHNSQCVSVFYPAFYMAKHPERSVLAISHSEDLATGFGSKVRDLIQSTPYQDLFPEIELKKDTRAKGLWGLNQGGVYQSKGTGGNIAGKGYHLGIIDDPISEQDSFSQVRIDAVNGWYGSGFYTRQMPEANAIIVMCTRWRLDDLPGFLLAQAEESDSEFSDRWDVLKIPGILDKPSAKMLNKYSKQCQIIHQERENELAAKQDRRPRKAKLIQYKEGETYAPRRWPLNKLLRMREGSTMTDSQWSALYQQNPVADEGGILKKKYWRLWKGKEPPMCEFIIQSYDTAFKEGQENDYTARTTWGVFLDPETMRHALILIEAKKHRWSYPDLRGEIMRAYDEVMPDAVLIEDKASGQSLIQDIRSSTSIPIRPVKHRRNDSKLMRAHVASATLELGAVWYVNTKWAREVIEECSVFPYGQYDDYVDSCTQTWIWLRETFWVRYRDEDVDVDEVEEEDVYYG